MPQLEESYCLQNLPTNNAYSKQHLLSATNSRARYTICAHSIGQAGQLALTNMCPQQLHGAASGFGHVFRL